jgi:hypothetical protein
LAGILTIIWLTQGLPHRDLIISPLGGDDVDVGGLVLSDLSLSLLFPLAFFGAVVAEQNRDTAYDHDPDK